MGTKRIRLTWKDKHPSQWTEAEFKTALCGITGRQQALAHRKHAEYGNSYACYGDFLPVLEVVRVGDRIRKMLRKYALLDDDKEVMGYDPAMFQDRKLIDQLQDIANYAMYAQFFAAAEEERDLNE